MAIAEGRTIPFTGPEAVDVAVLETFEYAGPDQEIVTETREFSPVCPYSGLPDFATLRIVYVPSDRCIELKSLKYYVTSYRSVGIFQEHATARIAEDLFRVLQPKRLRCNHDLQYARRVRYDLHPVKRAARDRPGEPVAFLRRRHLASLPAATPTDGFVGTASGPGFGPRGNSVGQVRQLERRRRHDRRCLLQVALAPPCRRCRSASGGCGSSLAGADRS